jgi:hypothetical protein
MFRDNQGMSYMRGLSHEIPDMARFLEWQRIARDSHCPHVRSTYCIGISVGGYAAIASGYFLNARIVWAFAPPRCRVEVTPRPDDEISLRCMDLTELLREGNGFTEYRIIYNEGYRKDREVAERLAPYPGVQLFPQQGEGHRVISHLYMSGKLHEVFSPFQPL